MRRRFAAILGNIALMLLGVVIALGLAEFLLRANPNWVPSEVRVDPPVRRVQANVDEVYDVKLSDGDLFSYMRGSITPLSAARDQAVAHVHMVTDAHGFRNRVPEPATCGIVALGDSFTRASGVATPWPQKLAESTGLDVFNLADVGIGPQQELALLKNYGLAKQPHWVILAYFEGNDLYDAGSYEQANPFILARFTRYLLGKSQDAWQASKTDKAAATNVPTYRYPLTVSIHKTDLELALFPYYVAWLTVSGQTIESSRNYRTTQETILEMRDLTEAAHAHLLVVYLPSKEHVYLPYLNDAQISRVFADVPKLEVDGAGYLQFTDRIATPDLAQQHMDDQAQLLADLAARQNISFLDLTSTFQKEAGAGAELYYPYDTHWNQRGQDLAAQSLAQYLQDAQQVTAHK